MSMALVASTRSRPDEFGSPDNGDGGGDAVRKLLAKRRLVADRAAQIVSRFVDLNSAQDDASV